MDRIANDVVVRPVRSREELEQALMLVHDSYVRSRYMVRHPSGLRINPYFALSLTRTFVALLKDEVVGTVSLFSDSSMLLPADSVFKEEMAAVRNGGGSLAEVGMLADRRKAVGRSMMAILRMMKTVFWASLDSGIRDLVITVNPKHVAFYRRLLCFEPMSSPRGHPAVGNAPAVLLRVNFPTLQPERAENAKIREMFLTPPQVEGFPGGSREYRITREDLKYFFVRRTDLFRRLTARQVEAIQQDHPGLRIAELLGPGLTPIA